MKFVIFIVFLILAFITYGACNGGQNARNEADLLKEEVVQLRKQLSHQRTFIHKKDQQLSEIIEGLHQISIDHQKALVFHNNESYSRTTKQEQVRQMLDQLATRVKHIKEREAKLAEGTNAFEQTRLQFRQLLETKEKEINSLRQKIKSQNEKINKLESHLEVAKDENDRLTVTLENQYADMEEKQKEIDLLENTMGCYLAVISRDTFKRLKKSGDLERRRVGFSSGYWQPAPGYLAQDRFLEVFQKDVCDETTLVVKSNKKPKIQSVHKSIPSLVWRKESHHRWRLQGIKRVAFWRNQPHLIIEVTLP
ncbi:hypothetical protein [Acanthopleuribacter pedis]|uniref:Uncharacterized protein n=1 Tax=Acanthopleuribacter pedis TaxID=442870 RepID=A0A8J7QL67_9BACT|nr:hypothetical protein [Acanthopleuribacter pedis]MBO1321935.1 hypothetical protein [Acanthopleuribacter pedis]